ncbi:MAG: TIGR03546 family protein [Planctomycetota bacterium]|nr:TIGR03546 family protein [Planctomycetota bacterium]
MVKLLSSIRRAIAGRKYPSQLAWAVSFGILLGVVPHGNFLAIAILIIVLSLRVNHAMAGLTAVAVSFLATRLDPYSHQLGEWVLRHPAVQEKAIAAWRLPLMPWTDLNNTVVMGSFLLGVAMLVPVFCISYPIFKLFAPPPEQETDQADERSRRAGNAGFGVHQVVLIDPSHQTIAAPHPQSKVKTSATLRSQQSSLPTTEDASNASTSEASTSEAGIHQAAAISQTSAEPETPSTPRNESNASVQSISEAESMMEEVDFVEIDHELSDQNEQLAVETRIDVIRMKDHRDVDPSSSTADLSENQAERMDEALNYLLRQLRDSKQRKAA